MRRTGYRGLPDDGATAIGVVWLIMDPGDGWSSFLRAAKRKGKPNTHLQRSFGAVNCESCVPFIKWNIVPEQSSASIKHVAQRTDPGSANGTDGVARARNPASPPRPRRCGEGTRSCGGATGGGHRSL